MTAPADELAALRRALLAGRWEHLTDPLLPLLLNDGGVWWPEAVTTLSLRLIKDMTGCTISELLEGHDARAAQLVDQMLAHSDEPRVVAHLVVQLAQHLARAWSGPRHRVALLVLERWPVE